MHYKQLCVRGEKCLWVIVTLRSVTYGNDISTTPGMMRQDRGPRSLPALQKRCVTTLLPLQGWPSPKPETSFPEERSSGQDTYHRACESRQEGPSTKGRHEASTPGLGDLGAHTGEGRRSADGGGYHELPPSRTSSRGHRGRATGRRWGTGPRDDSLFQ